MITSTKRVDNATEHSAAQFVRNLCEHRTRKPVLRHGAEIAVGVNPCQTVEAQSELLQRFVGQLSMTMT